MSNKEFFGMWAAAFGVTGVVVGWVFLCCYVIFPHSTVGAVLLSFAVIIPALVIGSWFMWRNA